MTILDQVKNLSNQTEVILFNQSLLLLENDLTFRDSVILNISHQLLSSTQDLSSTIPGLLASINTSEMQELYLVRNSAMLNDIVTELSLSVARLNRATNFATSEVNQALSNVGNRIAVALDVSAQVRPVLPTFLNATSAIVDELNDTQAVSNDILKNC